jgi:hypothetical protein
MESVQFDFELALDSLTMADIKAIAAELDAAYATPAEEIAATRSALAIEHAIRRSHRQVEVALAARMIGAIVQAAARRERVRLPDDAVTRVARAAGQYARALVAGDDVAAETADLGRRWQQLLDIDRATVSR